MEELQTFAGNPLPIGTQVYPDGVNFSVYSRNATRIFLDLFDKSSDVKPYSTLVLSPEQNRTGDLWHIFVKGIKAGTLYLFRVEGPFEPSEGHRFNPKVYLFDPRAKALTSESLFLNIPPTYRPPVDKEDMEVFKGRDMEKFPKCVVVDNSAFDWEGDKPLNYPLSKCVIYETHLKGFTAGKENSVSCPGTYAGFTQKIPYLKRLGVTSVELLPIFEFDEYENTNVNPRTGERMKNYWGYSTMCFFAPKASYAADKSPGGCVNEFKALVKELHKNGIEIILDVVFNHTAEGNENGITFCFRGFENSIFYLLPNSHKEHYMNFSGCGNTTNCGHPVLANYIIECLRYWVLNYHIDGFRFDLAAVLNRTQDGGLVEASSLVDAIQQDPVLHDTKMIAEPWDAGGAYQSGCFPGRWAEWNDRFRDDIRKFWNGHEKLATAAATRISGSNDLFQFRRPCNSINYITCHDGFTMNDLVSYNGKHNEENGEANRDGNDSNWSYNFGFEGPTANPSIERTRTRQMKNFILTMLISQGTPMLLAGDEFRRGQQGNNNAYCQDNETSYIDWGICRLNDRLVTFTQRAIELRKKHAVFRRENFFKGNKAGEVPDIQWYAYDGSLPDWNVMQNFLGFTLSGKYCLDENGKGDNDFYIAMSTDRHDTLVTIPTLKDGRRWYRVADTSIEADDSLVLEGRIEQLHSQSRYVLPAGSMIILMAK
ncbi:MAG: glycogen debranching protein GlgX [Treponema sp.]|nr:glycogen debranching protein GlgX [Treponema sp.]